MNQSLSRGRHKEVSPLTAYKTNKASDIDHCMKKISVSMYAHGSQANHALTINLDQSDEAAQAEVGNEVTLNTYNVISIDFLAQSSIQLLAHISNRKSGHI
jgi:hypothetical protein